MPSRRRRNSLNRQPASRHIAIAVLSLLASPVAALEGVQAGTPSPCLAAAITAEAEWNLPIGILAAIGRVESGRWDPGTRRIEPWPWTANIAGAGRYYATITDAVADVTRQRANGVQSVDVGCFQVNLMHHPNAFATLDDAFDPLVNARYAARFLTSLRANAGAWDVAVGQYHSASPQIGEPYRERVIAALDNQARPGPVRSQILRKSAAAPNAVRFAISADPYVIFIRSSPTLTKNVYPDQSSDRHVVRIRG